MPRQQHSTALLRCLGIGLALIVAPTGTAADLALPDAEIAEAYEKAATQNVLAAVNPKVFDGYFSVCADGQDFGYANTYPSLDGHQMTDALLFLGHSSIAKANFAYVRTFQRPNGQLPLAILPAEAGNMIGSATAKAKVDENGGLYAHWVPGDPLRALAGPTYIQNADVIYRYTQDRPWLLDQLPSVNLAADFLASLTTDQGAVGGAGYYVERPARIEYDGVAQCYAADAFQRVAALNTLAGRPDDAERYRQCADRITRHFRTVFWHEDHFAEYLHPERGAIASHGLTDVDWIAIAAGMATPAQTAILWPQLQREERFHYGGMPTGIATLPHTYEPWEFPTPDRMDLAAMGRVWYVECWARARLGDGQGLCDSIRKVCDVGRRDGYYWRERYTAAGPHGAKKYCEYPANLIRIVQRFLLGVEFGLDGTLSIAPVAPREFWDAGFGQTLAWSGRTLTYRIQRNAMHGQYFGETPQRLRVRLRRPAQECVAKVDVQGQPAAATVDGEALVVSLPAAPPEQPCEFEVEFDESEARPRE